MKLLDRYLARTVLLHTLMVMAVLLALMSLVTFINQQDDIGQGSFQVADAFLVTLLQLPQQAYELLPIGALIGAITGLGALARDSELTVLRAAGVSVARMAGSAAIAGVVVAAALWLIGEYFAPPADLYARQYKIFSRYSQFEIAGSRSAWVREGPWFINVRQQAAENLFGGVFVYELGPDRHLRLVGRAETARQDADGRWVLSNYAETTFASDHVETKRSTREVTGAQFNAEFLGLAVTEPGSLPLADLHAYRKHLRANSLDTRAWDIAFWSRVSRLVAAIVVCVFAVPFAFGPLRQAGAGARTVLGIMAGVLFILLTQTLENSGQVYDLNPLLVAWGPTLLMSAVAAVAIWRTR
ncbi:MAG TPA: LPS export ABC transporter permease LptG [Steroidobacteraceae bacterium]|nr:LPS export ABC transporter permease LptG [Steroidobacteraceae bacterium]